MVPNDARYHSAKSRALFQLEEDEAALKEADIAVALNPKLFEGWWNKGRAQGRLKHPEEALKSIDTAMKLAPDGEISNLYGTRSHINRILGRWEEALKDTDEQLKRNPTLSSGYGDRMLICEHLKRWPEVVDSCTKCLKHKTWHEASIYRSRGRAYAELHDYQNAVKDLTTAAKLWPDDIKIHRELKTVYQSMGDKKGMATEEAKIQSLNKDFHLSF